MATKGVVWLQWDTAINTVMLLPSYTQRFPKKLRCEEMNDGFLLHMTVLTLKVWGQLYELKEELGMFLIKWKSSYAELNTGVLCYAELPHVATSSRHLNEKMLECNSKKTSSSFTSSVKWFGFRSSYSLWNSRLDIFVVWKLHWHPFWPLTTSENSHI